MAISHDPWVWAAALLTLAIYSFLYKDNPFYKFAEHLYIGVSVGYFLYFIIWQQIVVPLIYDPLKALFISPFHAKELLIIPPLILSIMMLGRISPRHAWLSRWPMAYVMGMGAGLAIPAYFQTNIFKQIEGTIISIPPATIEIVTTYYLNKLLVLIIVTCVLLFFYFSREHKGALGKATILGRWFLMLGFGAAFGYTVMARVSLLIGRLDFLLHTWLGIH